MSNQTNPSSTTMTEQDAQAVPAAKPKLTGPKRQHFLPQFYLEGFIKDGRLAVYDRVTNEVRVQQPVNTGVIGHFYTLEDEEGRKRYELEHVLSECEGKASQVIKKLIAREDITADERADLAIFIALAAFRTPDIIDSIKGFFSDSLRRLAVNMFSDVEEVKERMRGMPDISTLNGSLEKEAQDLVEFANSDDYKIATNHQEVIKIAIKMALAVAPILSGRDWVVCHRENENKSYITTDAPVVLTTVAPRENNFWGVGFGNADAMVVFPLNESSILVLLGDKGELTHRDVSAEQIRHTNLALADRCQRFVIGREKALVRSLANRLNLAGKKWQRKMQAN
jgi:hypothetical protein